MNYIRNNGKTIALAVVAAAFLMAASLRDPGETGVLAWWGTIYPEFCFGEIREPEEAEDFRDDGREREVKISFWLAKALNW